MVVHGGDEGDVVRFARPRTDNAVQSVVSVLCCRTLYAEILTGHIAVESREARISAVCTKTNVKVYRLELLALNMESGGADRVAMVQAVWKGDGLQANEKGNRSEMVVQRLGC